MEIEKTKFIVEVKNYDEVNDHLKLGWILINNYVKDFGEIGQPTQQIFYVLAWQQVDEPRHPEKSSYLANQEFVKRIKSQSL